MKFKPKNRDELYSVIKEVITNQLSDKSYSYGLKDVDVSLITDMSDLFSCYENDINFEINRKINWNNPRNDITSWNVSNVTDMYAMFYTSQFNQPIGNWNVSNVTNIDAMFNNTPFNQQIGNWNVSNVIDMDSTFYRSKFNQDISNWNISNVTNMEDIFSFSNFNQNLDKWILKLNSNCILNDFNYESEHRKTYGVIDGYEDFIERNLTKKFIKETLQNGIYKDKFKLLKILKQYPDSAKKLDIERNLL